MAQVAKPSTGGGVNGGKFQDKDKPMEVRMSNITAAKGEYIFFLAFFFFYHHHLII
jgi:hypothetical protein